MKSKLFIPNTPIRAVQYDGSTESPMLIRDELKLEFERLPHHPTDLSENECIRVFSKRMSTYTCYLPKGSWFWSDEVGNPRGDTDDNFKRKFVEIGVSPSQIKQGSDIYLTKEGNLNAKG